MKSILSSPTKTFTFITPVLATAQNPHDVHFTGKGYELLGSHVAESIQASLKAN